MVQAGSQEEKYPEYLAEDLPIFTFDGFYHIEKTENKKGQRIGIVIVMLITLVFVCFELWPLWLQEAVYYTFVYTGIAYIFTIILRILLYIVGYHIGCDFWLFPNYFESFTNPMIILWPLASFKPRKDMFNVGSMIFRITSASLIAYTFFLAMSEEKIIEDL